MATTTAKKVAAEVPAKKVTKPQKEAASEKFEVPVMTVGRIIVTIRGTSPLLVHAWSEKAKTQMEERDKPKGPRAARDPEQEFRDAMYIIDGNREDYMNATHGIPAAGIKKMLQRAGKLLGIAMTDSAVTMYIVGDPRNPALVPIEFESCTMYSNPVRIGKGSSRTTQMRYRPMYEGWTCKFAVNYNAALMSPEHICNLLQWAGQFVGQCEWRQEKGGTFGCFEIATVSKPERTDYTVKFDE